MILIVEDEKSLGETLCDYLLGLGHQAVWVESKAEALEQFQKLRPGVVLMDIGLSDGSGLLAAQEMKKMSPHFVLFFLSAQNDPQIRLQGLEMGGDDYITKPFALKELTLRLERALKLQQEVEGLPTEIAHGPLKIWFSRYEVQDAQGQVISLTQKECEILKLLYFKAGTAVSREQMIEQIWGEQHFPTNRTVDNYIVRLRKWCESDAGKSVEIKSVRSIGYKLQLKDQE